jgi:26S proteasome regulatory subunit T4
MNRNLKQPENKAEWIERAILRFKEAKEMKDNASNVRKEFNEMSAKCNKLEENLKSLQNSGQLIGEILKHMEDDKYIVKLLNGPRYVVTCKKAINKDDLKVGVRISLDFSTLTIMRILPREIDPAVYNMMMEDPGNVPYSEVGGLGDQIRDLRECVELPLTNPEIFKRVGIKPPKGVLLYGPPGTGKTLLARAIACNIEAKFLKIVASSIVDKYIGESARMIREMFGYAKENQPCIIFLDEIDAIGGKRSNDGSSSDREIHRTLMELLNQLDGFDDLGKVKVIMATNRPDTLDAALLRPGRLDRKIEIPLPTETGRSDIIKIHAKPMTKKGDIDYEAIAKLSDGFNGADLRNICTEAGMFAIRQLREYVIQDDFMKATRKIKEAKSLETKLDYTKV